MKKTILFVLTAFVVILATGCSGREIKTYNSARELVDATKSEVNIISPEDFKNVMESGQKFYLIDCREPGEFEAECIKGALNVPRGVLEDEISVAAPNKRTPIYIYCKKGDRSILAASVLPYLKYGNVKVIDGGFLKWKEKFPGLVEEKPVRGNKKSKSPAAPSGGCGG